MSALHPIIIELLQKRKIPVDSWPMLIKPDFKLVISNSALLPQIQPALDRLKAAVQAHEAVLIYGDYDADGVPATALLHRAFKHLGVQSRPVIPLRDEGYGLGDKIVQKLLKYPEKLIITVDNGTVSGPEIKTLTNAGKEVIVIDHHQPDLSRYPETALAVINPKTNPELSDQQNLCACALAWKVAWALTEALGEPTNWLKWELDLVALSTVADVVPLIGENRALVQFGLEVLKRTKNQGLKALLDAAGIKPDQSLSAVDLGFKLAPRLNAPSRMSKERLADGTGHLSLELLITPDPAKAKQLAAVLNERNSERQTVVEKSLKQARERLREFQDDPVIVLSGAWSSGVIGLIAARLLEETGKPCLIISQGDELKGSVRAGSGVDALALIKPIEKFCERFGGHAGAAGLTLNPPQPPHLDLESLVQTLRQKIKQGLAKKGIDLTYLANQKQRLGELELTLEEADLTLAQSLTELEPFGFGFPAPLFESTAKLQGIRRIGKEQQHLITMWEDGALVKKGISFNWRAPLPNLGEKYRILYHLRVEEWQDKLSPSLELKQICPQSTKAV